MPEPRGFLLGVDGGATKTVAIVADATGAVLGAARGGSSDIHAETDPEVAIARVAATVQEAASEAALEPSMLASAAFSLCGADWPEDLARYAGSLAARLGLAAPPIVVNDAFGTLRAGTVDGVGVALVLGTGAAIAACGPGGSTWFSGFRMEEAGAIELGGHAWDLLIRGQYGPGPEPAYRDTALALFDVGSVEELVHAVTRTGGLGRAALPRLAPLLLEAADAGDAVSATHVAEHGRLLGRYAMAAAERVGLPVRDAIVVVSGGLSRHTGTTLVAAIAAGLDGPGLAQSVAEPAYGALLMAADRAGVALDTKRLRASGPGASFFDTR